MKTITEIEYYGRSYKERFYFTGIVKYANGSTFYYEKGKYHRLDGPAYEGTSGYKEYYIYGEEYSKEEYYKHPEVIRNTKEFKDFCFWRN